MSKSNYLTAIGIGVAIVILGEIVKMKLFGTRQ